MKSQLAQQTIDNDAVIMNNGDRMVDASTAYQAVEFAEKEAEERHSQDMRKLKARAVEDFRASCPIKHTDLNNKGALCDNIRVIGFDCNCPASECKFLLNFIQKLNEK